MPIPKVEVLSEVSGLEAEVLSVGDSDAWERVVAGCVDSVGGGIVVDSIVVDSIVVDSTVVDSMVVVAVAIVVVAIVVVVIVVGAAIVVVVVIGSSSS